MLHLNYDITHLRGAEYNPRLSVRMILRGWRKASGSWGLWTIDSARRFAGGGTPKDEGATKLGITRAAVYVLPCETTVYEKYGLTNCITERILIAEMSVEGVRSGR